MPIYEYICRKCGAVVEVIQNLSEPPLKQHDACGGKLEKKLSLSAFHLKGGGWYADGYSQSNPSTSKGTDTDGKKPATETSASEKKNTEKTAKKSSNKSSSEA